MLEEDSLVTRRDVIDQDQALMDLPLVADNGGPLGHCIFWLTD